MFRFGSFCALAFLAAPPFFSFASAQTRTGAPRLPSAAPIAVGATYRLGAEDTLSILVARRPEFSVPSVIVPSDGRITVPVVGSVSVAGRTLAQVDDEITRRFRVRLKRPDVTVSLVAARPRPVYVTGRVKNSGIFEFRDGWRITQALTAAGGTVIDSAQSAVAVTRAGRVIIDTPLAPILRDPTGAQNIELRVGDNLRFYDRNFNVNIAGAVSKAGAYSLPIGTTLVDLLSQAGGAVPLAALSKTQVRRANGQVVNVDLRRALSDGTAQTDFVLREGDIVTVPELRDRVAIQGAVEKPGLFPLTDGQPLRVADLLALAGGVKPSAALSRATLGRADGTVVPLDLYPVLIGGARDTLVLRPDDTLAIPEMRGISVTGELNSNFNRTGPIYVQEGAAPRIADILSLVGGLKNRPEESQIRIGRVTPEGRTVFLEVDPVALLNLKDFSQNARVQDGDTITITSRIRKVSILGEVARPGAYDISEGASIGEVIALAGGPTNDAALSQISISRQNGKIELVNLVAAIRNGTEKIDVPLYAGDRITLPRSTARAVILGAVNKPGEAALPEGEVTTVGGAISIAGGTRANANLKQIVLFRQGEAGVERKIINAQVVRGQGLTINTPVQKGDIVVVPEINNRQNPLLQAASIAAQFGFLLR